MDFEIFIKDNAFLPNSVDIKTSTTVVFMNEDNIRHNIHCKGHANFPSLNIDVGKSGQYKFAVPGRYEISENGIGDMKCVVEATEVDRENIPKRNYFPTSKEKKRMEEHFENRKSAAFSEPSSPIYKGSNENVLADDSQSSIIRHIDEYRTKRVGGIATYGRPPKSAISVGDRIESGTADSESDSSGEDGNLAQQRSRVKASTSKYNASHSKEANLLTFLKSGETTTSSSTGLLTTATAPATPPRLSHTAPAQSARPIHAPSLRTKLVLIEDYAFTVATLDVVVGQWIEFRLSDDVPAHAEHEICGISTVKALCFESPLLQQGECTSYTYSPAHPGEIVVSCKIYSEMSCTITVHPQAARPASTPPVSPDRASRQNRSPKVGFEPWVQRPSSPHVQAQSPVSPTSPAYQDVGEGVLQFDASRSMSPRRGELSESQSSFYDSDDIFSDYEASVATANLETTFDDMAAGTRPPLTGYSVMQETYEPVVPVLSTVVPRSPAARTPRAASHIVSHIVTIEEFTFRPSHLVTRCGEWVRFRRPAAQVATNLVCEGEFVASEVNWPVEGDYLCLDHCFTNTGSFEVQNVIFTFCKCNVIVVPQSAPATSNSRKGATPKLHGSFSSTTVPPAQPIFHFPITEEEKRALKVLPRLGSTTTTTVNATSTTTVISTAHSSTSDTSVSPIGSIMSTAQSDDPDDSSLDFLPQSALPRREGPKGPSETTPLSKPVPLYGSFMNLSNGAPGITSTSMVGAENKDITSTPIDGEVELFVNKFKSSLHTHEEGSDESDAADADAEENEAAAARRKKKNQKKKEKLKQKQKLKKQAALEALESAEREPLLGGSYLEDEDVGLQVDTNLARELRVGLLDAERSPEMVIDKYLTDVEVSRSYIHAQIDWGEEIEFEEESEDAPVAQSGQVEIESLPSIPSPKQLPPLPPSPVIPDPPSEAPPPDVAQDGIADVTLSPAGSQKKKRNRAKNKRTKSPLAEEVEGKCETEAFSARIEELIPSPIAAGASSHPSTPPRRASPVSAPASAPAPAPETPHQIEPSPASEEDQAVSASIMLSPESFVTPTKTRKPRKERLERTTGGTPTCAEESSVATPPPSTAPRGVEAESASKRNSQLLRSVLRISPQRDPRDLAAPSTLFPTQPAEEVPITAPVLTLVENGHNSSSTHNSTAKGDAHLSACFAFEQQMEEFFMSRYENILAKFRSGETDRLPSGKEVGIFFVEDMREVTVSRGKTAHNGGKIKGPNNHNNQNLNNNNHHAATGHRSTESVVKKSGSKKRQ